MGLEGEEWGFHDVLDRYLKREGQRDRVREPLDR